MPRSDDLIANAGRFPTMMRAAQVPTEQFEVAVERDQPASLSQLAEMGT